MAPIDPKLLRRVPTLRTGLRATAMLAAAGAAAVVAQAVALSFVLVAAIDGEFDAAALGFAAAAFAARALVSWGQQVTSARTAAAVKLELRDQVLRATGQRRPLWSERAGEAVTLITRGVDGLDAYITGYLPQLCLAATVPVTILVVLAFNDWPSLVVIAITVPLIPVFGILIGWHTKSKTEKQWRTLSRLGGHFLDTVSGLATLRVFGRAAAAAKGVGETAERYRRATMETLRVAFLSALALELVATVSVALVAVPIGLRLVDGAMDLRTAFLVLLLAPEVYLPLRAVGTQFHAAAEGVEATREALALVDEAAAEGERSLVSAVAAESPQAVVHPQDSAVTLDSARVSSTSVRLGEEVGGPGSIDGLEFADLTVAYPDRHRPALDGLSGRLEPGRVLALVGPSGAGKTTLLNVLMGFVEPTAGTVRWGGGRLAAPTAGTVPGTGEQPSAQAANQSTHAGDSARDLEHWRRRIVWVPQRPHLFAATLADNIRLGQPDASLDEVAAAAAAAHATEFIDDLPDGYDTGLGPDGFGLSAGQSRRIALARAFLRLRRLDCPLVLLDEPTASLDAVSETLVAEATVELLRGRTAIIVAHRPALVDLADEVWRIESGRLPDTAAKGART